MSLAIVDSGVANLASVIAALKRLNVDGEVTSDPQTILAATHVILPGVGAATAAMAQLSAKKLIDVIRSLTQPTLGICLGMQLMFSRSDEGQGVGCLDVIQGTIRKLSVKPDKPIPHMGWNQIKIRRPGHPLLQGVGDGSFVYFVHSYAAPVAEYSVASCEYSEEFTAIAEHKNFFSCQFHPERSGAVGSRILKNFVDM
jgi:glutamine amidotransferase